MQIQAFQPAVQALFNEVQDRLDGQIILETEPRQEEWVAFDQSGHRRDAQGNVHIILVHSTQPDFTLAHELHHVLFEITLGPQVQFPVTTARPELDQQIQITAQALVGSVEHGLIMDQQRARQEITPAIEHDFIQGIAHKVPTASKYFPLQVLMLLDALTFSDGQDLADWQTTYAAAFVAAQTLYQQLKKHLRATPTGIHRSIVELWQRYSQLLEQHQYLALPYSDFISLAPVLSPRQLRLTVEQLFFIKHLPFNSLKTHQRAYALVGRQDQQNAGELLSATKVTSVVYQQWYQQPVQEFLQQQQIQYQLRT